MTTTTNRTHGFVPEDLRQFPQIVGADFGCDARTVVVAATTIDGRTAIDTPRLWSGHAGGELHPLTPSDVSATAPAISPDGTAVAFVMTVEGVPQLAVTEMTHGEPRVLTSFRRGVGPDAPRWSPDGTTIAVAACDLPPRDPSAPYRVTRAIWRRDGMGLIDDVQKELWLVPVSGGEPARMSAHGGLVSSISWSPDGSQLLYNCFAEPQTDELSIHIVGRYAGSAREVLRERCLLYPPGAAWLPDGRVVRTTTWDVYRALDLVVHNPATGQDTPLDVEFTGQLCGLMHMAIDATAMYEPKLVVDPDTGHVYVQVQNGGRLEIVRVDPATGDAEVFSTGDYSSNPLAIRAGHVLAARTSFHRPTHVMAIPAVGGDDVATELASFDITGITSDFTIHHIEFSGVDGQAVEGWYLEPSRGSAPYPTVLNIHGGPFACYGHAFSPDNEALVGAGYGVLLVNQRMSSGYGEEFASPIIGDWGNLDASDLLAGIDDAVERGLADPDRLGSYGISGGGYLTAWLLTHSDRFKAGVSQAPVTDFGGMIGSDIPEVIALWMNADAGGGRAAIAEYSRMSPATYAAACSTPMLIIEHEDDLRCPVGQGDVMYNALRIAGCPVEMLRIPGWPHGGASRSADVEGRIVRLAALTDWMDRYVR